MKAWKLIQCHQHPPTAREQGALTASWANVLLSQAPSTAFRLVEGTVLCPGGPATAWTVTKRHRWSCRIFLQFFSLCFFFLFFWYDLVSAKWRLTHPWGVWSQFQMYTEEESLPWPSGISSCWRQTFTNSWVMSWTYRDAWAEFKHTGLFPLTGLKTW